jgi:hypothetical protein
MQTQWAAQLNPLLANQLNNVQILEGVSLNNGAPTVINHLLGRQMQGWFILDINRSATIYRSAPLNATTLTLFSNAACTVNIGVF